MTEEDKKKALELAASRMSGARFKEIFSSGENKQMINDTLAALNKSGFGLQPVEEEPSVEETVALSGDTQREEP